MMHLVVILFLLFTFSAAKEDTDKKIKKTASKLSSYSKNYSRINKKMSKTAKAILKQKRQLKKQNKYLKKLKEELALKEKTYKTNTSQLSDMKKSQSKLKTQQAKIEEDLVFVIAKSVSLSIILEENYTENENSLIEVEILKNMLEESKNKAEKLSDTFFSNSKNIDSLNEKTSYLEVAIANIDAKRKKLLKTQSENKKALKKLEKDKESYKKELKVLLSRQNTLKSTLAKLNIVKIDEINKAKEEAERKKAFEAKKIEEVPEEILPKVKKHGNSYQAVKTKKYRGVKTIAPLDEYTITKGYGTYTDPIYGIKIFNESISLKPKISDAKVKTVFNGKVIYADKTAVLNNIVIVEHNNGLHTIYANLSQISPNIKNGIKIKKGFTIGRVADELVFEVTQKSYHINPIRLFK
ncbi:peptidoglycan DD-metalloendopeptidase family protein [Sulfurimonas aquatica]|uniref:Peptidoglycan DD-metalloendopeptidase family protein n=1 Tax=Sulfurimonas aquatica TaxID=2672570 RepID=A0A975B101_9BACT|nr:peptidoglycan DD-metalloendopeptidase family protein [Sulfurimonas aquatica]QSZ42224.1 peptidoglycan DD-metalloendopeptidase family protein [Sulfurimonas aquatica]